MKITIEISAKEIADLLKSQPKEIDIYKISRQIQEHLTEALK